MADFGRAVATAWEKAEILFFLVTWITHNFTDFPSDNFHEFCTQQRQSVSRCNLSDQNFEHFIIRVVFSKKNAKISRKCSNSGDFRPPELRIDNRSPETHGQNKCLRDVYLFSIFIVGINSNSFPCPPHSVPERTYPQKFGFWRSDADDGEFVPEGAINYIHTANWGY